MTFFEFSYNLFHLGRDETNVIDSPSMNTDKQVSGMCRRKEHAWDHPSFFWMIVWRPSKGPVLFVHPRLNYGESAVFCKLEQIQNHFAWFVEGLPGVSYEIRLSCICHYHATDDFVTTSPIFEWFSWWRRTRASHQVPTLNSTAHVAIDSSSIKWVHQISLFCTSCLRE